VIVLHQLMKTPPVNVHLVTMLVLLVPIITNVLLVLLTDHNLVPQIVHVLLVLMIRVKLNVNHVHITVTLVMLMDVSLVLSTESVQAIVSVEMVCMKMLIKNVKSVVLIV
jgi:hypothetical protein